MRTIDNKQRKAFYGDRISDNMTVTPEGFLICHNVPISKIGTQEYLGEELEITEQAEELITVIREEKEVFSSKALASFEGKSVTNEHPDEDVTSSNYKDHMKGHVTNVRQGNGGDTDKVVADLVIYDRLTIEEIQNGKREISCGYDCVYVVDENNNIYQTQIRGNHVALVESGRAGHKVRIKDKSIKNERSRIKMSKRKKESIIARILGFAKDADPDEVAEVIEEVTELQNKDNEGETTDTDNTSDNESASDNTLTDSDLLKGLVEAVSDMKTQLDELQASSKDTEASDLDKLEDELSEEESVTVPVDELDEDVSDSESEDENAEDEEDSEINDTENTSDEDVHDEESQDQETVTNNDSLLRLVRDMKPVIARIKDPKEKKRVSDSLVRSIRRIQGRPKKKTNGYRTILDIKQNNAKKRTSDKNLSNNTFDLDKQQKIYDKYNPHKKGAK